MARTAVQCVGARGAIEGDRRCAGNADSEDIGCRQVAGVCRCDKHAERPRHGRHTTEDPRLSIETEPWRQRAAVGECGAVGQHVACVGVGEGAGVHRVAEDIAHICRMIGKGCCQLWRLISNIGRNGMGRRGRRRERIAGVIRPFDRHLKTRFAGQIHAGDIDAEVAVGVDAAAVVGAVEGEADDVALAGVAADRSGNSKNGGRFDSGDHIVGGDRIDRDGGGSNGDQ